MRLAVDVSVVIPTVNRLAFLRQAIRSALEQSRSPREVVVSDNSGDPHYALAIETLVRDFRDPVLRVVHQPKRLSMVEHCNVLIDLASSEYWLYLPDDDWLEATCLERMAGALQAHPSASFAFSDHWLADALANRRHAETTANSHEYGRDSLAPGLVTHEALLELAVRQCFELQSMLFRRTLISALRFDPAYDSLPDYDLQIRAALSPLTGDAVYVKERLTTYRLHAEQFTSSFQARRFNQQLATLMERVGPRSGATEQMRRRRLARANRALALCASEAGERRVALMHLRQALRTEPTTRWTTLSYAPLVVAPRWT
ncbi:MAG TPA: glycosyltransferase family A protein, partial [Polyangiaceae bacterium]|nr:glycosyltransferase family A protein [Polyangiaceae bacterium]